EQTSQQITGQLAGEIADNRTYDLRIGNSKGGFAFDGVIDEVRVWNVARTAEQIQVNMNCYLTPNAPGLIGYWKMEAGNGQILNDDSNNGHAGKIEKAVWVAGRDLNAPTRIADGDQTNAGALEDFSVFQNYPNPFNGATTIHFALTKAAPLKINIFNLKSELVKNLADQEFQAGRHTLTWNGQDRFDSGVSSGLYFCKIESKAFNRTIKLVFLK
ncbi:T9SS type A sorting domain-containing protein, partial [candidate division KSB1 bacterium]|nr:T9SS type A sorting domain-containing protein [candidate division KSB1 bacterium]